MQSPGYCECGCGERTSLPASRFRPGHNRRRSGPDWLEEDRGFDTPCWVWQRGTTKNGYAQRYSALGQFGTRYVHVQNWIIENGPVPEDLELDHLCRVRNCVNPAHLEPVTRMENLRRGRTAKLTPQKAAEIRGLTAAGWLVKDVAAAYGIGPTLASDVKNGRRWSA